MSVLVQGCVSVDIPDTITIPAEAGTLSEKQLSEMFPVRYGVSLVCSATADSMRKDPSRLAVPNVDPDLLESMGQQADELKQVIKDVEVVLVKLVQAARLLDRSAYTQLRKVLAAVRGLEKFDPTLPDLVPDLISFFATRSSSDKKSGEQTTSNVSSQLSPA